MIILARKGSICLTVDNGGLYGVEKEKISKKYGKIYLAKFFSEDKQSAINYFNKKIKEYNRLATILTLTFTLTLNTYKYLRKRRGNLAPSFSLPHIPCYEVYPPQAVSEKCAAEEVGTNNHIPAPPDDVPCLTESLAPKPFGCCE